VRVSFDELERRLRAEPGVEHVAFADRLPVMDQFKYQIDVDTTTGASPTGLRTSTLVQVSPGFFSTFGTSVIAGRGFSPADFENRRVLIVNESFVRYVFGGRNAIGQRVRVVSGEDNSVAGKGLVRDRWRREGFRVAIGPAAGAIGALSSASANGGPRRQSRRARARS
jgi:hypothetical protein